MAKNLDYPDISPYHCSLYVYTTLALLFGKDEKKVFAEGYTQLTR